MSLRYNGDKSTGSSLHEQEEEKRLSKSPNEEFNTSEEEFRGFEKKPLVICERFDITPYLNKNKRMLNKRGSKPPDPKKMEYAPRICNEAQLAKMLHECSVILVRDDLEQLKELVKNKSPILNGATGLKCKICDKEYSSDKKLQNHIDNKHIIYKSPNKTPKRVSFSDHIIVHEVKEYHRCRKCPKIFEDYNTLKLHMKQKHKKRKCYICHYCSKDFVDRMFFKIHIRLHCDVCGLFLSNRKRYLEHRRQVCRILKKYECKTCHMQFFHFMDLKDHSYDHLGIFFICDVCKDQFSSKCAVAHHIKFLHSNKRPDSLYSTRTVGSDKVFICNFCEESTIEEEKIDNHVLLLPDLQNRVMTGYNDYYFCDQCLKKFNTEKDMLQHKWSHFLKTSDTEKTDNNKKSIKLVYKMNEKLPKLLQPNIVLEKLVLPKEQPTLTKDVQFKTPQGSEITLNLNESLKKAIIDPVSKKTILSKHQCVVCILLAFNYEILKKKYIVKKYFILHLLRLVYDTLMQE